MALLDRIKFDGLTSKEWLIYRYPTEKIPLGSTLIVGEGQAAVFVSQGKIADIFTSGSYVLQTGNLPILGSIINLAYGGKTPFTAEIYYVNTATKLDMYWGTTDSIQLIDPKYYVRLHIRAFGQFGVKIIDITSFLRTLIGSLGNQAVRYQAIVDFFKGLLNTKIKTLLSDVIINQKISAFEITPKLEEISELIRDKIDDEFLKYGLSVENFYIQSVNFPDEDFEKINKILEDKAAFEIMGDSRYATKRSFDVYEGAANNSSGVSGAFVASGLGLGLGANMANNLSNTVESVIENSTIICPNCNAKCPSNSAFCISCGSKLQKAKQKCPKCGTEIPENSKFCLSCGASLANKQCACGSHLDSNAQFCPSCGKKVEE